jgi:corrinoid protein of di/trimethylamine methyltransferase
VDPVIDREISRYNSVLHLPSYRSAPVRRTAARPQAAAAVSADSGAESVSLLDRLSAALQKGQQKRVLKLCRECLDAGLDAQVILSDGLVRGMVQLGEDFTANRAFVPEMLLAARCMTAATELLKPHLTSGGVIAAGRVCLGTVKGDMHDIGKNLVKVMMEGSGLEVIDLGTDVSAETFVETAKTQHCDIIACSALLTTTMGEMRRVVELAKESGIRDQVKIMVGGAPITQSYCDEIGADLYTADAASAAKAAVAALAG